MSIIITNELSLRDQFYEELEAIQKKTKLQESTGELCHSYIKKITTYINKSDKFDNELKLSEILRSLNDVSMNVSTNLELLKELRKKLFSFKKVSTDKAMALKIDQYNLFHIDVFNKIDDADMKFQEFNNLILQDYAFVIRTVEEKISEPPVDLNYGFVNSTTVEVVNNQDNNVLRISEKDQKAYLPYKYSDIESIFNAGKKSRVKYRTPQDVINHLYTVPFSAFRFPIISRFREAFNLVMLEKKNLKEAIFTGVEVMGYHELNPIIIRACENIQEFNIYLDCLAENELDQFPCFDIKFEVAPMTRKARRNSEFFTN